MAAIFYLQHQQDHITQHGLVSLNKLSFKKNTQKTHSGILESVGR